MVKKNVMTKGKKKKALAFFGQRQYFQAIPIFREICKKDPRDAESFFYLGVACAETGDFQAGIVAFKAALELRPGFTDAREYLAKAYMYVGDADGAIQNYRKLLSDSPAYLPALEALGKLMLARADYEQSELYFRDYIRSGGSPDLALGFIGNIYRAKGDIDGARKYFTEALDKNPYNLRAAVGSGLSLPVIYNNREHMLRSRQIYAEGIDYLGQHSQMLQNAQNPVDEMQWSNFYLAYQGENDRDLQERLARFFGGIVQRTFPQFSVPLLRREVKGRRVRVGFASHFIHAHTVSYYFNNWMTGLGSESIETYVYHINPVKDDVSGKVEAGVDNYRPLTGSISRIAEVIKNDGLDMLIYPEVGMYSKHYWLAALRLAPIQCVAWGHPVTTGLSTVDYYLSASATEPEDAQNHYSESLYCLPSMGVCVEGLPVRSRVTKEELGFSDKTNLYLCPQSLFKIHVDTDSLFAEIAARDPNAQVLFFQDKRDYVNEIFSNRLRAVFEDHGCSFDQVVRLLPRMGHSQYLDVNCVSDVMLDTLHFSGGRTSLDAFSSGLPIVTLPGRFSRGRQTMGMYQQMGLADLTVSSSDEYVRKAVEVAANPDLRDSFSKQILTHSEERLFNDAVPLEALSEWILSVSGE